MINKVFLRPPRGVPEATSFQLVHERNNKNLYIHIIELHSLIVNKKLKKIKRRHNSEVNKVFLRPPVGYRAPLNPARKSTVIIIFVSKGF
ncbi:hypothetical protein C2I06_19855 [Niallia circulans]|nr:hypothetical protein C2I06_19855 [Niallia circulans]